MNSSGNTNAASAISAAPHSRHKYRTPRRTRGTIKIGFVIPTNGRDLQSLAALGSSFWAAQGFGPAITTGEGAALAAEVRFSFGWLSVRNPLMVQPHQPHNFAPAHPTSASAQATPKGTFAVSGFSSEIDRSGLRNRARSQKIRPIFPKVRPKRPCQITIPSAIPAFTSAATKNTGHSLSTPRTAPEAPTSFQSPYPKACKTTKGNKRSIARPRPSSEDLAPGNPK